MFITIVSNTIEQMSTPLTASVTTSVMFDTTSTGKQYTLIYVCQFNMLLFMY